MPETVDALTRRRAFALSPGRVSYLAGSKDKGWARSLAFHLANDGNLSPDMIVRVERLAWTYRRQIPADLVPGSKPPATLMELVCGSVASRTREGQP